MVWGDNMSKCMRKVMDDYDSWQEKSLSKHNHNFCIPAILETKYMGKFAYGPRYGIKYQEVLMCNKCHSFKIFPNKGNIFYSDILDNEYNIDNYLSKEQQELPLIKGIKNKSRFDNIIYNDELYFPDGFIYKKDN